MEEHFCVATCACSAKSLVWAKTPFLFISNFYGTGVYYTLTDITADGTKKPSENDHPVNISSLSPSPLHYQFRQKHPYIYICPINYGQLREVYVCLLHDLVFPKPACQCGPQGGPMRATWLGNAIGLYGILAALVLSRHPLSLRL